MSTDPVAKPHIFHFWGAINYASLGNMTNFVSNAIYNRATQISFHIASNGGDINAGIAAYNFLRSISIPFSMHNFSNIDSIAVILFLSAKERYCVPHAKFMIHPPTMNGPSSSLYNPLLKEMAMNLQCDIDRYVNIFKENTQDAKEKLDIKKHMQCEPIVLDAEQAKRYGIVTDILDSPGTFPHCAFSSHVSAV
ncbi:ATP-dependent Clp protease proteolytic subunit [uncultured Cloacibacillus sp.]|uniref:ATP-dependent Clp protease proteolytic subunit n=1 Tax=uncultured Cloacibacillus sp. TaxID=889794 RepID=UPI002582F1CA|nr:ATP-dependent Clp protease proteolytic subunit [uncultured Cloacibacillus sp.]